MCEREDRDDAGRFRPGASGNPAGKPLQAAGDGRRVVDSDTVARPDGDMRVLREPVHTRVMLPSSVDPVRYLYPPGRTCNYPHLRPAAGAAMVAASIYARTR